MKNILLIVILANLLTSCTSWRMKHSNLSPLPDYNQRVLFQKPHYRKQMNIAGFGSTFLATAGSAYFGYKQGDFVTKYHANGTKPDKISNSVIGVALGFGVSSLVNYMVWKKGKLRDLQFNLEDETKFTYQFSRSYKPLNHSIGQFEIIRKDAELAFKVYNHKDLKDFKTAFSNSILLEKKVKHGITQFSINDLMKTLEFDYNSFSVDLQKMVEDTAVGHTRSLLEVSDLIDMGEKIKSTRLQQLSKQKLYQLISDQSINENLIELKPLISNTWKRNHDRLRGIVRAIEQKEGFDTMEDAWKIANLYNEYGYEIGSNEMEIDYYLPKSQIGVFTLNKSSYHNFRIEIEEPFSNVVFIPLIPENIDLSFVNIKFSASAIAPVINDGYESKFIRFRAQKINGNIGHIWFHAIDMKKVAWQGGIGLVEDAAWDKFNDLIGLKSGRGDDNGSFWGSAANFAWRVFANGESMKNAFIGFMIDSANIPDESKPFVYSFATQLLLDVGR